MIKAVCHPCKALVASGERIPCAVGDTPCTDCKLVGPCDVVDVPEDMTYDEYRNPKAPQWSESTPEQLEFDFDAPVIEEIAEEATKRITSDGGSTSYYDLPQGASQLNDLIEHKDMPFARGNIFKACYRMGEKSNTDALYDINKIIFFAERMRGALLRGQAI